LIDTRSFSLSNLWPQPNDQVARPVSTESR